MILSTKLRLVCAAAVVFLSLGVPRTAPASEALEVTAGHSKVIRAERGADIVIVGNDDVANATLATENTIVVTGQQLGSTNMILLDEDGSEILSTDIHVVPVDHRPQFNVQLIAGRETLSWVQYRCGPEPGCVPGAAQEHLILPARDIKEEAAPAEDEAETEPETDFAQ